MWVRDGGVVEGAALGFVVLVGWGRLGDMGEEMGGEKKWVGGRRRRKGGGQNWKSGELEIRAL